MTFPLSDITVLDMSRVMAGPWATQLLADLGATVIKIEKPGKGDDTRHWGPPFMKNAEGEPGDRSAYFCSANHGKHSVVVDFTTREGQDVLYQLAATSDVVVENYRPGTLARYRLDAETLRRKWPALVYCSISGFGQDGPSRDRPGYDYMMQAAGGLMSVTGEADGDPMRVGIPVTDMMTGMYAVAAILAALHQRAKTGRGSTIDLALFDVQTAMLANQAAGYLMTGEVPERIGNRHPMISPYQPFRTADGWLVIAVGNDDQFSRLCAELGLPECAKDARFATNAARVAHHDTLTALLTPVIARHTTSVWQKRLDACGIPNGPVNTLEDVFAHPQLRHRNMVGQLEESNGTPSLRVNSPLRFDARQAGSAKPPPALGEDTETVLQEMLGLDDAAIAAVMSSSRDKEPVPEPA